MFRRDIDGQTYSEAYSEIKRRGGRNTNHNRRLGWQALILNANAQVVECVIKFVHRAQSARKHAKKLTKNRIIAADMD
uniref:Uncharacterized protein n=1 Tax=Glossina palpalis gambiensis TaxID=67801 RepID=A0A1B0AW31_9MUSC